MFRSCKKFSMMLKILLSGIVVLSLRPHYAVCQKCIMLCVKNSNFSKKGMFFPFEHRSPGKVCTIGHARDVQKNR